eukprot:TRINITY_DN6466_c1_g1_i1.p1 TRINITY_DN6466_c1_g1~~TRINITY_DN6466_c1_g1_i1.p1  ORF type:complete len:344 (-),score=82.93 TRINITY_DN6466_c1_g1_i1:179-1210(-)
MELIRPFGILQEILEQRLSQRVCISSLLDRNILRALGVAFKLQSVLQQLLFRTTADQLSVKLHVRPSKDALIGFNILKRTAVAPFLSAKLEKLQFQKRVAALQHLLVGRPPVSELLTTNILRGGTSEETSYILQGLPKNATFLSAVSAVDRKLCDRPSYESLCDVNIIRVPGSVSPKLQAKQQRLKFSTTAAMLDHKLEKRPSALSISPTIRRKSEAVGNPQMVAASSFDLAAENVQTLLESRPAFDDLIDANILKENYTYIAPSLHATRQQLSKRLYNSNLSSKIATRPSIYQLQRMNIMKNEGSISKGRRTRQRRASVLQEKIEHRPSPAQLIERHVLLAT